MENGHGSSNGEDELQRLLMDYENSLPPLPPISGVSGKPSQTQNKVSSVEIAMNKSTPNNQFRAGSVASSSVLSPPKKNFVLAEMEKAGGEESFSRFLNTEKTVTRVSPSIFGSFTSNSPPPCVAQPADDAGSKISPPAIVAAQPSASPAPTKTRRGGYRKAMPPEMLANLVMHDPKKAKRLYSSSSTHAYTMINN